MPKGILDSGDETFDPARRVQIIKAITRSNPNNLAALAITKHHEKETEKEEKRERYLQAQKAEGEEFASRIEANLQEILNNSLSAALGETDLTPAIKNLGWKMDRDNLKQCVLNTSIGVKGLESGSLRCASLFSQVLDGLWIEAAPWGDGSVHNREGHPRQYTIKFYLTTDIHNMSAAVPLKDANQLGAAIAKIIDKRITS